MDKVLVTFDVAAEDGSGFTDWTVELPREDAGRFAEQVAKSDPDESVTFCKKCPNGSNSGCPHGTETIRVLAIGNLRIEGQPGHKWRA